MIKIAITGSIGMGKTTISNMLKSVDIPVYNSDETVKNILLKDEIVKNKITNTWPKVVNSKNRSIDKKKLRKIIFFDKEEKKKLENILHPLVEKKKKIFINQNKRKKILAFDIPLLYETNQQNKYDYIFLAICKFSTQKKRVLRRKGMNKTIFKKINESQIGVKEKIDMKPIIINTERLKILSAYTIIFFTKFNFSKFKIS